MIKWISVKTRKPPIGIPVLIFYKYYSIDKTICYDHYDIAIYCNLLYKNKRVGSFVNQLQYSEYSKLDSSKLDNIWVFENVSHWAELNKPKGV